MAERADSTPGITIERRAAAAVVRVARRLDLIVAPALRRCLEELVADGRRWLVVDLAGAPSLDSSGLSALVAGWKRARDAGGDLRLAHVGEHAALILRMTSLDRVLRAYASVEAALEDA